MTPETDVPSWEFTSGCRLCRQSAPLRASHIVPAFVFKWLRRRAFGHIRRAGNPNVRIQDGAKLPLLCEACEQRFSKWENEFAARIFPEAHRELDTAIDASYDEWAKKFAVSISWRILLYEKMNGYVAPSPEREARVLRADRVWAEYLLEQRPDVSALRQHLIFMSALKGASGGPLSVSPFMNRYLTGVVDMDIVTGDHEGVYTYAKLGRILLFGEIEPMQRDHWENTVIRRRGRFSPKGRPYAMPEPFARYLVDRAQAAGAALSAMSEKQKDKVDAEQKKRKKAGEEYLSEGMIHDALMFGAAAFEDLHHPATNPKDGAE